MKTDEGGGNERRVDADPDPAHAAKEYRHGR